ncbi:hypothetical protein BDR03DRAFT_974690 [Suillus americanus]|nr:hypothetical protein BDR03DRAFT_974690 [Suillus americanus]
MRDVAVFVTSNPTLDVSFNPDKGKHTAGPITIQVALASDADEDPADQAVGAPFGPAKKDRKLVARSWEPSTK